MSEERIQALTEEVRELQREVRRLRAVEDIRRTKYRYWRCFDTADLDGMREVLHPDVVLSVVAGIYSMKFEGRDAYLGMVREGAHAEAILQHHGHHGEIDLVGDDEAIGTWYLYDDIYEFRRGFRLYGTAFYRDRYLRENGAWRIIYSQFHRIYEIKEELESKPEVSYSYLAGHGYRHPQGIELPPFEKAEGYRHPKGEMPPFLDYKG